MTIQSVIKAVKTRFGSFLCELEKHDWEWYRTLSADDNDNMSDCDYEDGVPTAHCVRESCQASKGGSFYSS